MATYSLVDEGTTANTTDWIGTGTAGSGGEVVEFGLTTVSDVSSVSQVQLCVHAQSATNANGSTLDSLSINLRVGGTLQTATTVSPAFNTWANHCATFNGTWSQAQLDGTQAHITRNRLGSGSPANQDDDVRIANVYATVTYVQTVQLEQSTYRWFNNQDTSGSMTHIKASGGSADDGAYTLINTSDGGFATVGYTTSFGAGGWDMLLSKYDAAGTLSWSRTWGGASTDVGRSLAQTGDGGYIVSGYTNNFGSGGNDMFLLKYDAAGVLSWSRTWGGTSSEIGLTVVQTGDGGYAVTGETISYGNGGSDMFLAKYDSAGTLSWSRTWGNAAGDRSWHMVKTSDGGFAITGQTASYGAGLDDMFLAKYDSAGTLSWSRTWGGTGTDWGYNVVQTSDGGYAVTGYTNSHGAGGEDMFLVKYDASGALTWNRVWGGTGADRGYALIQTGDGGYLVTGHTFSYGSGIEDMFLAKYDSSGTLSWSRTWGNTGTDRGLSLLQMNDGGYSVSGFTTSYGSGQEDVFLSKYDSNGTVTGCSSPMCQSPAATTSSPAATTSSPAAATSSPTAATSSPTATTGSPAINLTAVVAQSPSVGVGSALSSQDTVATIAAEGTARLRIGLHVTSGQATAGAVDFKLQYAAKGTGTCAAPSGGVPATYTDVTSTTRIAFANNPVAVDGQVIATDANDPIHSGHTTIRQSYEESNSAPVSTTISSGQDGLWDFFLKDNGAMPSSTYCFRLVFGTGSSLSVYSSYPELTTSAARYEQSAFRVYENAPIQGDTSFIVSSGSGAIADTDVSVFQTSDGGYITGGSDTNTYGRLVKYTSTGTVAWSKRVSYGEIVDIYSVIELSNGEIIAVGNGIFDSNDPGTYDSFIAKFSSSGSFIWSRLGFTDEVSGDVVEAADGSVTTIGSSPGGAGGDDALLTNFSASTGAVNWSRLVGGSNDELGLDIAVMDNGDYIIGGDTYSYGAGSVDGFIAGYSSNGTYQWMRTVGGAGTDSVRDIASIPGGGFAVLSSVGGAPNISSHAANGATTWTKQISNAATGTFSGIAVLSSGNIVVGGHYNLSTNVDFALLDGTGVVSYSGHFQGSGTELIYDVADTSDGGFVMVGRTNGYQGQVDNLLMKYDGSATVGTCDLECSDGAYTSANGQAFASQNPTAGSTSLTVENITYASSNGTESLFTIAAYSESSVSPILPGNPIAGINTVATLPSAGSIFRLRALTHMMDKSVPDGVSFRLQFTTKSSTCSASTGYSDVTLSSAISFYDNPGASTGASLGSSANDPTHLGHAIIAQNYVESNPISTTASVSLGSDAMWDFVLKDNGAPAATSYCLRLVAGDGSLFDTYTHIAEITTANAPGGATLNQQMRGGQSVVEGVKQRFLW